jgi:hypothetical protein
MYCIHCMRNISAAANTQNAAAKPASQDGCLLRCYQHCLCNIVSQKHQCSSIYIQASMSLAVKLPQSHRQCMAWTEVRMTFV